MIGGWNPEDGTIDEDIGKQILRAFKNVELALKQAGGTGWNQVYRVTSYHTSLDNDALTHMVENFKRWMPDHKPIWTAVGVERLGLDDMKVEIEVSAHLA